MDQPAGSSAQPARERLARSYPGLSSKRFIGT